MESSWSRTCRLCLYRCGDDRSNMIHIFTHPLLAAKISYVTDLQVTECDGLPSVICQRCSLRLNSAESFKRLSHSSDDSLRSQFIHLHDLMIMEPTCLVEIALQSEGLDEKPLYQPEYEEPQSEVLFENQDLAQTETIDEDFSEIGRVKEEEIGEEGNVSPYLKVEVEEVIEQPCDSESSKHTCEICGKNVTTAGNLRQHMRNVHENKRPYKCTICDQSFNRRHHLKRHSLRHSNVQPIKTIRTIKPRKPPVSCAICDKVFSDAHTLARHRLNLHSNGLHQCRLCDLSFTTWRQLRNHRAVHATGTGPHKCETCGKGFDFPVALLAHLKSHDRTKEEHRCEECGRVFSLRAQLVQHSRTHSDDRPFACNICQARFKAKIYLERHTAIHTGAKPFLCSFCGKGFGRQCRLTSHHRVHTGERPYTCEVCGKHFPYSGSLAMHMKRHAGVRPYVCDTCGSTFLTVATLDRHKRTHTGERPHVCTVCSRGFGRSEHLATHMLIHTGERMYHCEDCQKTFVYKVALVNHYKKSCRKKKS